MIRLVLGTILLGLFLVVAIQIPEEVARYSVIPDEVTRHRLQTRAVVRNGAGGIVLFIVPGVLLIVFGWRSSIWGIRRRLKSSDPIQRRLTAVRLVETGKTGQLLRLLKEGGPPEMKEAVTETLIKIGEPVVEPLITSALWNEMDPEEAARILKRTPIQPALKVLDGPLKMQNAQVQKNARYLMLEIATAGIHSRDKTDVEASVAALEQFATSLLEKEKPEEAENIARRLLEHRPDSDAARTLWKKARQAQGKDLTLDLPEEKKKEIYTEYHGILDGEFLGHSHFAKDFQLAAEKASISEMGRLLKDKSAAATFAARDEILQP